MVTFKSHTVSINRYQATKKITDSRNQTQTNDIMSGASVLVSSESRRGKMVVTGRGGSRHHLPMHRGSGVAGGGGTVATAVGGGGESIPGSSQRRMMSSGQQKGQSRGLHPMCCNRCRKPLSTTIFVCSCDCVFCEGNEYFIFSFLEILSSLSLS